MSRRVERGATKATRAMPAPSPAKKIESENNILSFTESPPCMRIAKTAALWPRSRLTRHDILQELCQSSRRTEGCRHHRARVGLNGQDFFAFMDQNAPQLHARRRWEVLTGKREFDIDDALGIDCDGDVGSH